MIKTAIIEDSQALASVYKTYLKSSEFDVSIFSSSIPDVNRLIKKSGYKIIICPCFPKHQDGPEIANKIKADPELSSALFVISTTMQKDNIQSEWDLSDIDKILFKPFDRQSLEKTITDAYYSVASFSRQTPLALVIDDSKAVRTTLSSYLKSLNFDVKTASDGAQGLKTASNIIPDLIIVDVEMPVMNGFEFTRQLSKISSIQQVPVIVVSGTINEAQFAKGFNVGAIDFLEKPVSQTALASIIESVSIREQIGSARTTVILSRDHNLNAILNKSLNFLNSSINLCGSIEELETYLCVSIPDIIILNLSEYDEKLNICMHVRNLVGSNLPVVIAIADQADRDIMFQCFKFGATEFIIKPFGRDEVKARIENHIQVKKLQDELVKKNMILESLAYKDKLTGLMNRRYFDKAMKDELVNATTHDKQLSFVMLDL
ncbi:MAG: response regulator, partial [Desulfobacteraceae bacterium]|nr:response regulator [Desulfobacteraceae bacterium]